MIASSDALLDDQREARTAPSTGSTVGARQCSCSTRVAGDEHRDVHRDERKQGGRTVALLEVARAQRTSRARREDDRHPGLRLAGRAHLRGHDACAPCRDQARGHDLLISAPLTSATARRREDLGVITNAERRLDPRRCSGEARRRRARPADAELVDDVDLPCEVARRGAARRTRPSSTRAATCWRSRPACRRRLARARAHARHRRRTTASRAAWRPTRRRGRRADEVVVATHYPMLDRGLLLRAPVEPERSYALGAARARARRRRACTSRPSRRRTPCARTRSPAASC